MFNCVLWIGRRCGWGYRGVGRNGIAVFSFSNILLETAFRNAELSVFSNAKNHRRDPLVPLIVPLANAAHLSLVHQQRSLHSPPLQKGFIVTNANCSTTAYVVPLAA